MSQQAAMGCHGVQHKTTAVSSMPAAVGIASKGLSKQTMEQRGSLVLLIMMDCMLKLW